MTDAMSKDDDSPAQAQRITQASDLITTILALGAGLDPVSAHAASHNANEHNKLQHLETLKALGLVKEGEEVYEGDEPEKTEVQQQYERGRQRHIKDALDHARRTRGRALSVDSHKHVVENAGARYDHHHGAIDGAVYSFEYGLMAASYIPGPTGFAAGVVDAAYGYHTGRYDALDVAQTVISSSSGVLRTARPFVSAARGADKLGRVAGHGAPSAAAAAPSKMPVCMTKSHAPTADVFKRVARDDWYIPQSQTGSDFLRFDARASRMDAAAVLKQQSKVTREKRWMELAAAEQPKLPKEVVNHIMKSKGKGVSRIYGLELAHKPGKPSVQGHDYREALPKTIADHRGIEHRFLRERKDGTTILRPPHSAAANSMTLPKPDKLPK